MQTRVSKVHNLNVDVFFKTILALSEIFSSYFFQLNALSFSDLMIYLNATKISRLGNNFSEYSTDWAPQKVLNMLAQRGYRCICMAGVGQTCIWTLFKHDSHDLTK